MNDKDREIIREAVHATLKGIGFNMDDPTEIQADIHYLRKIRKGADSLMYSVRNTAVVVVLTALLYGVWETIKTAFAK